MDQKKATKRLLIAAFAPAVGAGVGSLLGQASALRSKKKLTESQKKDRKTLGETTGGLLGVGVSAKMIKDLVSGSSPNGPGKPPGKKSIFKFEGKIYKKPPHPNIIRKRGNLIKVDFAKKPGFIAGFKKIAGPTIASKAKSLGKHLHKYRKEYIMSVGSTGSVGAALNKDKEK